MKKRLLSLFALSLCLVAPQFSMAQAPSGQTWLYALDAAQIETLHQRAVRIYQPQDKVRRKRRALVLSAPIRVTQQQPGAPRVLFIPEDLPPGTYLSARINGSELKYESHLKSEIEDIQLLPGIRSSLLLLQTPYPASELAVKLKGKSLAYDAENQAWRLPGKRWSGLLSIQTPKETRWLQLKKGKVFRKKQRIFYDPQSPFPQIVPRKRNIRASKALGYLALSQPRYRPGDSLHLKAYLVSKKGNPLTDSLDLYCSASRDGKPLARLAPRRPGLYLFSMQLKDSLNWRLDQRHSLSLHDINDRKNSPCQPNYFTYEDYELDQFTFELETDQTDYQAGQDVNIFAAAKDGSGTPVPGTELILSVNLLRLQSPPKEEVALRQRLLQDTLILSGGREPVAVLPDSLFGEAEVEYRLSGTFRSPDNQLQTLTQTFSRRSAKAQIYGRWRSDSLLLDYEPLPGDSLPQAWLIPYPPRQKTPQDPLFSPRLLRFPHIEIAHPQVQQYQVLLPGENEFFRVPNAPLSSSGRRHNDSAFFQVTNPKGMPIFYQLSQDGKELSSGLMTGGWQWEGKGDAEKAWVLQLRYVWKGEYQQKQLTLSPQPGKLNVAVEQAEVVQPGDSAEVRIRVRDETGRPLAGVDLTAFATNSLFPEDNAPDLPLPHSGIKNSYRVPSLKQTEKTHSSLSYLQRRHLSTFGLDSLTRYRLWYPEQAEFHYQPIPDRTAAQFAPYLHHEGSQTPILMIYANGKLIYYAGAQHNNPFAFWGERDTVDLRLRSLKAEYLLKDVVLKKGHKLELSINPENLPDFAEKIPRSDSLSKEEMRLLQKQFIWLDANWEPTDEAWIWQAGRVYALPQRGKSIWVGPLTLPQIAFARKGEYGRYLLAPQGRSYRISADRLESWEAPEIDWLALRGLARPRQAFGELALRPADLKLEEVLPAVAIMPYGQAIMEHPADVFCSRSNAADQLILQHLDDSLNCWAVHPYQIGGLEPGCYRLFFRRKNGRMLRLDSFCVKADHLNVVGEHLLDFHFDSLRNQRFSSPFRITPIQGKRYFINEVMVGGTGTIKGKIEGLPQDNQGIALLYRFNMGHLHFEQVAGRNLDGQASFQFKQLAGGTYRLLLLHPDFEPKWWKLNPSPNESLVSLSGLKPLLAAEGNSYREVLSGAFSVSWPDSLNLEISYRLSKDQLAPVDSFFLPYTYPPARQIISWNTEGGFSQRSLPAPATRPKYLEKDFTGIFDGSLSGQVISQVDGSPIPYALVYTLGSMQGTRTDQDGYFSLGGLQAGDRLIIKYLGVQSDTIKVGLTSWVTVALEVEEAYGLDEVVVVGYGRGKSRRNLASQTSSEATSMLSGKVSGIQIRGARKYRNAAYVDGVKVRGRACLPRAKVEQAVAEMEKPEQEEGLSDSTLLPSGGKLRSDFRDAAYWQPDLLTDAKGEVRFFVKYPDDLTGWRTHVLAMHPDRKVGRADGLVKVIQQLSARLSLPRFLVQGDEAQLLGQVYNYLEDSISLKLSFGLGGEVQRRWDTLAGPLLQSRWRLQAPREYILDRFSRGAALDTLKPRFMLRSESGFLDGEERDLPIFPKGTIERKGKFFYLEGDSSFTYDILPEWGEVELRARANALEVLQEDLAFLQSYPHFCNEQTASKLSGLLLARQVDRLLGTSSVTDSDIARLRRRLQKAQNEDGSWGWWPGQKGNLWMTIYVARALDRTDRGSLALSKALSYLRDSLRVQYRGYGTSRMLHILLSLEEMGMNTDEEYFTPYLRLTADSLSPYQQMLLIRYRQVRGQSYQLDSLWKWRQTSLLGGYFWGDKGWRWYGGEIEQSLLAYQVLRDHGGQEAVLQKIRAYLFETRGAQGWRNTVETARILATLIPDLDSSVVSQGGGIQLSLKHGNQQRLLSSWPQRLRLSQGNASSISLRKQGRAPLFLSLSQHQWQPEPEAVDSLFALSSWLEQGGGKTPELQTGQAALLKVELEVKKAATYVVVEVPIPAGCSYGPKNQRSYRESYREYRKEKVSVYFEEMPAGKYEIQIKLEPRFAGRYSLNPARAELMYEPVFFGRNEVTKVEIREE